MTKEDLIKEIRDLMSYEKVIIEANQHDDLAEHQGRFEMAAEILALVENELEAI